MLLHYPLSSVQTADCICSSICEVNGELLSPTPYCFGSSIIDSAFACVHVHIHLPISHRNRENILESAICSWGAPEHFFLLRYHSPGTEGYRPTQLRNGGVGRTYCAFFYRRDRSSATQFSKMGPKFYTRANIYALVAKKVLTCCETAAPNLWCSAALLA